VYEDVACEFMLGVPGRLGRVLHRLDRVHSIYKTVSAAVDGQLPEHLGKKIFNKVVKKRATRKLAGWMTSVVDNSNLWVTGSRAATANNIFAGRQPVLKQSGWHQMVIVYHEADKAGRHIDIHIGSLSIVKRLPDDFSVTLKAGRLTEASKKRIMDLVAAEFLGGAWLAQNLDHTPGDARTDWHGHDRGPTGYGAGAIREVVSDEPVWLTPGDQSLGLSAPHLVNNKQLYIYEIMSKGAQRSVPILSLGVRSPKEPVLRDRLHLTLDEDVEKFRRMVGPGGHVSVKYDGASCYVQYDKKGVPRVWSPRLSVKDGKRIEYTTKVPGLKPSRHLAGCTAMGELLFVDKDGKYLSAAETGGVLNAGKLDPQLIP